MSRRRRRLREHLEVIKIIVSELLQVFVRNEARRLRAAHDHQGGHHGLSIASPQHRSERGRPGTARVPVRLSQGIPTKLSELARAERGRRAAKSSCFCQKNRTVIVYRERQRTDRPATRRVKSNHLFEIIVCEQFIC